AGETVGTSRERQEIRKRPARPRIGAEARGAATIEVRVFDTQRRSIHAARVHLRASGPHTAPAFELTFDTRLGAYTASGLPPEDYLVEATAPGVESERRRITADSRLVRERFILGPPGLRHYFRGTTRVPIDPGLRDLIGVGLRAGRTGQEEQDLVANAAQHGLTSETVGEDIKKNNVRVFRFAPDASDTTRKAAEQALDQDPAAKYAGAVVRIDDKSVSFL